MTHAPASDGSRSSAVAYAASASAGAVAQAEHVAAQRVQVGVVGRGVEAGGDVALGAVDVAELEQDRGAVEVRVRERRVEVEHAREVGERAVEVAELERQVGAVVVRLGIRRAEADRVVESARAAS